MGSGRAWAPGRLSVGWDLPDVRHSSSLSTVGRAGPSPSGGVKSKQARGQPRELKKHPGNGGCSVFSVERAAQWAGNWKALLREAPPSPQPTIPSCLSILTLQSTGHNLHFASSLAYCVLLTCPHWAPGSARTVLCVFGSLLSPQGLQGRVPWSVLNDELCSDWMREPAPFLNILD